MAERPVFLVISEKPFVKEIKTDFEFFSGFALSQKQKSIESLHNSFIISHPDAKVLEVSRKSNNELGPKLSAFNLRYKLSTGENFPLECVFQSSKVFKNGQHYPELLKMQPGDAKTFMSARNNENGDLLKFTLEGKDYPLEPKTSFYDWIYLSALRDNRSLAKEILDGGFDAFTDIEFNPKKSYNCQARTVALFVSLSKRNLLEQALGDFQTFCKTAYPKTQIQQTLF